MKGLLILFMILGLSACASNVEIRDVGRETGKDVGQHIIPKNHENNGKGPYGPGRSS